jgi:hypothetical protein
LADEDEAGVWNIELSAGNVIGEAYYMSGGDKIPLSGVLVQATASGKEAQTTVTKGNGTYALQLENGVNWTIKFFFVSRDGVPAFTINSISASGGAVTASSSQQTRDGQFQVAP